jgi:hypothetical protein
MITFATLALLAPLVLSPQEDPGQPFQQGRSTRGQSSQAQPDMPLNTDLVMVDYRPQNTDIAALYSVARQTVGRNIFTRRADTPEVTNHFSIQLLGDRIAIYETATEAIRVVEALRTLDLGANGEGGGVPTLRTVEYRPKHVPLHSLGESLQPFRNVMDGGHQSVTAIQSRGILVLRDTPSKVQEVLDFLAVTDRPTPQVLVTTFLVKPVFAYSQGAATPTNQGLPGDLVRDLAPLLSATSLSRLATGMVRVETGNDRGTTLNLESPELGMFEFNFTASAYSPEDKTLTLDSCTLVKNGKVAFDTRTSVSTEEYVVLGATGPNPAYLVIHISEL